MHPPARDGTRPVVIVSGIPRSGTSMMMAMLQAGGLRLLTDEQRPPDADNPGGYYEYAPARKLHADSSWIAGAAGKAVKIISFHLFSLPPAYTYRIILMERSLPEVLASQRQMLVRAGESPDRDLSPLGGLYARHGEHLKQWLATRPDTGVLSVDYRQTIADPSEVARAIADFLSMDLDIPAMSGVVDGRLYRHRCGAGCI